MSQLTKRIRSHRQEIEVPIFKSVQGEYIVGSSIMDNFLPELFEALQQESRSKTIFPGKLDVRPAYDIKMVQEFPAGKSGSFFYYPGLNREDHVYTTCIDIIAGTVEKDSAIGLSNQVLATLHNDGHNWRMRVNSVDDLAVNPDVLYKLAEKYAAKASQN